MDIGPFPNFTDLVGNQTTQEDNIETQEDKNLSSFGFTRELDPTILEQFKLSPDPVLDQDQTEEIEPLTHSSVSTRGRVRRPAKRPLDDEFLRFS